MRSPFAEESEKKAAFNFYNGYLAVVYGLLITDGLQDVVGFTNDAQYQRHWNSLNALLFLGTFLTSLHFWYVCATVDDLSQSFYRILAGENESFFDLLPLFDALIATALAGLMLAMFRAIPPEHTRFFLWFFLAAGLSLLYDCGCRFLLWCIPRQSRKAGEPPAIRRYHGKVAVWMKSDLVFVIGSGAMFLSYPEFGSRHSLAFGSAFAVSTFLLLLSDVNIWTLWKRAYH